MARGTRRGKSVALAALTLLVLSFAAFGCGRDDFKNEPRPPLALEVTVEITAGAVQVSPPNFGAGLANFSIANTSDQEAIFRVEGPTANATAGESEPIAARGNTVLKVPLEQGKYEASVVGNDRITPAKLTVGPERESAQDDLLLP